MLVIQQLIGYGALMAVGLGSTVFLLRQYRHGDLTGRVAIRPCIRPGIQAHRARRSKAHLVRRAGVAAHAAGSRHHRPLRHAY